MATVQSVKSGSSTPKVEIVIKASKDNDETKVGIFEVIRQDGIQTVSNLISTFVVV